VYEAYRVRSSFQWGSWQYAPAGDCGCGCGPERQCTGQAGTGCICHDTACHCHCGIPRESYGGDIWIVQERHPHKDMILGRHRATADLSILDIDTLLKDPQYARLVDVPVQPERETLDNTVARALKKQEDSDSSNEDNNSNSEEEELPETKEEVADPIGSNV